MKTFRDNQAREWAITVDVAAIKRVMQAPIDYLGEPIKVNLLALVDFQSDLLKKLVEYPPMLCDVLYALCKPQCDEKSVSDEDFGRALAGEALETAQEALIEGVIDFFPPARRTVLRRVLDKSNAYSQKVKELAAEKLNSGELDRAIDKILDEQLQKLQPSNTPPTTGTDSAGSLPESSASTPDQEPSPN